MRVFMLGWEFPPFISGGLGTACYGLTKALSRLNTHVVFVLPRAIGQAEPTHVRLLAPTAPPPAASTRIAPTAEPGAEPVDIPADAEPNVAAVSGEPLRLPDGRSLENVSFRLVPSRLQSPYPAGLPGPRFDQATALRDQPISILNPNPPQTRGDSATGRAPGRGYQWVPGQGLHYGGDLITEAKRYADLCTRLALRETFDVVHAHDWLTFPAGMAVAAATGKPLVVHVHSTEFDRSGEHINPAIFDIERRGMLAACRVVAVSHLTRTVLQHRYKIDPKKIEVVYNGIDFDERSATAIQRAAIRKGDKIVLFLGRVTMQKGPEYFVAAARKVLEKYDRVKFVMAGSGDRIKDIIELAAAQGIGHKVLFTGFLSTADVQRVFRMTDVFVMPSVSEPFGIAPLEAISHDVPVIISKQSGVSEVLSHALKVDFWDIDDMADKILAVLKHPPLSTTLREQADIEVRKLTWKDAAEKVLAVYDQAQRMVPERETTLP